ncbi:MAG: hypothetical protein HY721_12420 [Planctomycetes bacterium]|nr:hypothetical protein [Planctomycetota bacterium]
MSQRQLLSSSRARPTVRRPSWASALVALALCRLLPAESLVQNPSFELNFNETWPHYGPVDAWTVAGGTGVNQADGPFHNVGTAVPDRDRIAFLQGSGTLSQAIVGLTPGKRYWIQLHYDARACCGGTIRSILVKWNGEPLDNIANVVPAGGASPSYAFQNVPFTPEADAGTLTFETVIDGDATALFDAVTIVQRDEGNVVVANPSFEASGPPTADIAFPPGAHSGELFTPEDQGPANLAGWTAAGDYGISLTGGIYADNGAIPDQDLVGFIDGPGSLSQTISGLAPGTAYDLSFAYNARTGSAPHLEVRVGEAVLSEEDVSPVGGDNPYHRKTVSFDAAEATATIAFAQTLEGQTLLLDDVRVVGRVAPELPPLRFAPAAVEIGPTLRAAIELTVPAELLERQAVGLQLAMDRPERAQLMVADEAGILTLLFEQGGSNVQSFEVEGVSIGTASLSVLNLADFPGLKSPQAVSAEVTSSFVRNASFEGSPVPPGPGYGPILGWAGGSGLNGAGGPFADNGIVPDRSQVAFLQGAAALSQEVVGLTPGKGYWLQLRYNARAFGGTAIDLSVVFDSAEIQSLPGIVAVGDAPYSFANIVFVPARSSGLLELRTSVAAGVDATLLLDAVSIVQREPGEVVIENPSFEASGSPVGVGYIAGPIAGWSGGSGINIGIQPFGPFTDNGAAPDQDRVLFKQGPGTLGQRILGLTPGEEYTLTYSMNRRLCCELPSLIHSVSLGEQILITDQEVFPAGLAGEAVPYTEQSVPFVATSEEADLVFALSVVGDATFLIDDVRIRPGEAPPREVCDNGADDDGDGKADCADQDCAAAAACQGPRFHRGDADQNGTLQLTDAVQVLGYLFLGIPTKVPDCLDAADADDNGQVQLTDAVRILGFLFLGLGPPAPPGPPPEACGADVEPDPFDPCSYDPVRCQ